MEKLTVLVHIAVLLLPEQFIEFVIFNIGCLQRSCSVSFYFGVCDTSICCSLHEFQVRLLNAYAGTGS